MIKFIENQWYGTKDNHYKIMFKTNNYIIIENCKGDPFLVPLHENSLCQWFSISEYNTLNVVLANDGFNYTFKNSYDFKIGQIYDAFETRNFEKIKLKLADIDYDRLLFKSLDNKTRIYTHCANKICPLVVDNYRIYYHGYRNLWK